MADLKAQFEAAAKEIAAWKPAGKDPSDDEKLVRRTVSTVNGLHEWIDGWVG